MAHGASGGSLCGENVIRPPGGSVSPSPGRPAEEDDGFGARLDSLSPPHPQTYVESAGTTFTALARSGSAQSTRSTASSSSSSSALAIAAHVRRMYDNCRRQMVSASSNGTAASFSSAASGSTAASFSDSRATGEHGNDARAGPVNGERGRVRPGRHGGGGAGEQQAGGRGRGGEGRGKEEREDTNSRPLTPAAVPVASHVSLSLPTSLTVAYSSKRNRRLHNPNVSLFKSQVRVRPKLRLEASAVAQTDKEVEVQEDGKEAPSSPGHSHIGRAADVGGAASIRAPEAMEQTGTEITLEENTDAEAETPLEGGCTTAATAATTTTHSRPSSRHALSRNNGQYRLFGGGGVKLVPSIVPAQFKCRLLPGKEFDAIEAFEAASQGVSSTGNDSNTNRQSSSQGLALPSQFPANLVKMRTMAMAKKGRARQTASALPDGDEDSDKNEEEEDADENIVAAAEIDANDENDEKEEKAVSASALLASRRSLRPSSRPCPASFPPLCSSAISPATARSIHSRNAQLLERQQKAKEAAAPLVFANVVLAPHCMRDPLQVNAADWDNYLMALARARDNLHPGPRSEEDVSFPRKPLSTNVRQQLKQEVKRYADFYRSYHRQPCKGKATA